MVQTVARMQTLSGDRPERCALNYVLNYSGLSICCWLYSNLVDPFKLTSCHRCTLRRFQSMFVTHTKRKYPNRCGHCCDFDYNTLKDINTFAIPEKIPMNKRCGHWSWIIISLQEALNLLYSIIILNIGVNQKHQNIYDC